MVADPELLEEPARAIEEGKGLREKGKPLRAAGRMMTRPEQGVAGCGATWPDSICVVLFCGRAACGPSEGLNPNRL
ncbi:hypothetical protein Psi01_76800 [Planobispora siamensis]|uniref:Uncharacterized protein n=1 Tax=Planobispora siamensis TaxID=936338 RepID=A0A8J3SPG2_9ACTN|nr:hypothetical protein Psi01_76800 [Planobispora siamensis]